MTTLVWAFRPLKELNGQTHFVECDDALAARLIEEGKVQDPLEGAWALKPIEAAGPPPPDEDDEGEYETKVVTPKRKAR